MKVIREIKFRFTFINGNYIKHIDKTLDELLDCSFVLEEMTETINHELGIFDLEDYIEFKVFKRQSTGLLDKNGVEIHEGDIVKWGHIEKNIECWHRIAFVELFPSLGFRILHYIDGETLEKKKGDNHLFGFSNFIYTNTHEALEVIGNIYEDKDLVDENGKLS